MSWLTELRIRQAVTALSEKGVGSDAQRALDRLAAIGAPAIGPVISTLSANASWVALERLLARLLNSETLPEYLHGLKSEDPAVATIVSRILRIARYDPNQILVWFRDPDVPRDELIDILSARSERLRPAEVLKVAEETDATSRTFVLRLLAKVANEEVVPEIAQRLHDEQYSHRVALIQVLERIASREAQDALVRVVLADRSRDIRLAALRALGVSNLAPPLKAMTELLRDSDMVIRNQAVEILSKRDLPGTEEILIPMLEDPLDNVRRSAIEVLHDLGRESSVPALVTALADEDWWVRARAADALVAVGGAEVVEAVLPLLSGEEFEREKAVEILQRSKSDETVDYLLESLGDERSQIRDPAVEALAALKDPRAVHTILPLLSQKSQSMPMLIGALGEIGDPRAIPSLLARLDDSSEFKIKREAIMALQKLSDGNNAQQILTALEELAKRTDSQELQDLTIATVIKLEAIVPDSDPRTPISQALQDEPLAIAPVDRIDPLELRKGEMLGDRYEVIRRAGRGGFGVILLALDKEIGEEVILKFLASHLANDDQMIQRFKHEIRYARRITHSNVIRIFDLLLIGGNYVISMEYFESHQLSTELKRGALSIPRSIRLIQMICDGLEVAHDAGVIHRDLTPANLLVNDDGEMKIVDFGLAAAAGPAIADGSDPRLTQTGLVLGTPAYMAPEQARRRKIDRRTDIYSLGVVLYQMLTGKPPYIARDPVGILLQHLAAEPKPPTRVVDISAQLEAVVLKAMALEPTDRFQTAAELKAAISAVPEAQT